MLLTNFHSTILLGHGILFIATPGLALSTFTAMPVTPELLHSVRVHGCSLIGFAAAEASVGEKKESLQCLGSGLVAAGVALGYLAVTHAATDARAVLPMVGLNIYTGLRLIAKARDAPSKF